jgi:hypothetical protein
MRLRDAMVLTLSLESCGIAGSPFELGGIVISQTPYSFLVIGWDVLFQLSNAVSRGEPKVGWCSLKSPIRTASFAPGAHSR